MFTVNVSSISAALIGITIAGLPASAEMISRADLATIVGGQCLACGNGNGNGNTGSGNGSGNGNGNFGAFNGNQNGNSNTGVP